MTKSLYKDENYNTAIEKLVVWSDEDGLFIGSAPPIIGNCCHGVTEEEVWAQLDVIIREYLEDFALSLGEDKF